MMMEVNRVGYHVEECGSGFPLLLLHGFTGDTSTWTPFCSKWGTDSKLVIPDIIGHGKTDSPDDWQRYRIEAAAADLAVILTTLGIERADVLGYSMGGRLALTFALLYPNRVRKLVLESASPGLGTEEERKLRCMKDAELANFIIEQGIEAFVDHWENIPLFETMKRLPIAIQSSVRAQRVRNSPMGLANSLRGMGTGSQPSWWVKLPELECPVLLLTGELDKKFCGIAAAMQKYLKNSAWVTVPDSGHAIHVEKNEKFGTIVSDFLNRGGVSFDS
jgi:2-succinyl-6-hydroxy-2,4-cyclohexadiene-1-carboxylate synthase